MKNRNNVESHTCVVHTKITSQGTVSLSSLLHVFQIDIIWVGDAFFLNVTRRTQRSSPKHNRLALE